MSNGDVDKADAGNFAEWCVLELMGHRRLAGYVTEQEIARSVARGNQPVPVHRWELPGANEETAAVGADWGSDPF